jgi:KDO2-lipid IV(A) lauroyltransferase
MIGFLLFPISLIPLRILYFISDFLAFFLYYIFKYRRRVVAENIYKSFLTLSDNERIIIEKKFYRHFCDNLIETLKLLSMSQKKLASHMSLDCSHLEKLLAENQKVHIYLGHQFNWEWAVAHIESVMKKTDVVVVCKPFRVSLRNNLMVQLRSCLGLQIVSLKKRKKEMDHFSSKQRVLVLVADQKPKNEQKSYWTSFLSQRTAFLKSIEINTAIDKTPSLFGNIIPEKRGYYKFTLEPIFDFSQPYQRGIITKIFVEKLEKAIVSNPYNYRWSHKRWEHTYKNEYHKRWINRTLL